MNDAKMHKHAKAPPDNDDDNVAWTRQTDNNHVCAMPFQLLPLLLLLLLLQSVCPLFFIVHCHAFWSMVKYSSIKYKSTPVPTVIACPIWPKNKKKQNETNEMK